MLRTILVAAALCAGGLILNAREAEAQCAAKAVAQNATLSRTASAPSPITRSNATLKVWKTVTLGDFANSFALRNALDAANCGIGYLAEEIIARPAFTVAATKTELDLVAVSPAELGFADGSASLREIYLRAEAVGLSLAPAETGPELRLQYFDQPLGEFLRIGMKPITTWNGDPVIFVVANGGAGLIVIGQKASADTQIPTSSPFLFVRARELPKVEAASRR